MGKMFKIIVWLLHACNILFERDGTQFSFQIVCFSFYSFNKYEDLCYLWYTPSDIGFLTPTLSGNVFQRLIFTTPGGCFLLLVYVTLSIMAGISCLASFFSIFPSFLANFLISGWSLLISPLVFIPSNFSTPKCHHQG